MPRSTNAHGTIAIDGQMTETEAADMGPKVARPPTRRIGWLSVAVFVAIAVIATALSWSAAVIHQRNESRLLSTELGQATSVIAVALPDIESPITTAAQLAGVTDGNPAQFDKYMASLLGKSLIVSASLWHISPTPTEIASVGAPLSSGATPSGGIAPFVSKVATSSQLDVVNLLGNSTPTIDFASTSTINPGQWVVFADTIFPKHQKLTLTQNSAFAQLRYSIYFGPPTPTDLIIESAGGVNLGPGAAKSTIPIGNTVITVEAKADGELGGTLLARLPWIVGIVGGVLAIIAAWITEFLVRRRRQAEWLASENRRMYKEQLSIAEILQHALLPQALPQIAGIETAARYVAGREGTEVGGDWYDIIPIDESRFVFVVGDVSGRGVVAATIMARLHFAIRAYAAQGDSPEEILKKLGTLLSLERDKSFATILCCTVDVSDHSITVVNAGHPPLLLMNGKEGEFVKTAIFPPVGVLETTDYKAVTLSVPPRATLIAFTDGLIERRGEIIDTGLARLRNLTSGGPMLLDDLLSKLLSEMNDVEHSDDLAILAVRWNN
ncbi:MAG: PP2C family protein-serine/threonine phosphatase [Acidimicrobiales bacterium]